MHCGLPHASVDASTHRPRAEPIDTDRQFVDGDQHGDGQRLLEQLQVEVQQLPMPTAPSKPSTAVIRRVISRLYASGKCRGAACSTVRNCSGPSRA